MATIVELPVESFEGIVDPDWCPGCGDFGVLKGVKMAATKAGVQPKDMVIVSGIGCSSNLPGYVHAFGVHSLHGRAVAVATGIKLANTDLKVVITGGDGDGYGIGIAHFIHAMRRNLDLTYVVMDNQIYGLTTGQASPTTMKDARTKSTPNGNVEFPINPIALALVSGATFVARAFSGEPNHMADLIAAGIQHKGFALIDVFSPCVTYNKLNTYQYFKKRVYKLEDEKGWDSSNVRSAMERSHEWGDRIPIGLFYQDEQPTYESSEPVLRKGPVVRQNMRLDKNVFQGLVTELM
ncbi:MAG TPA: 2-oxoacid:ferredoxin oxidoreductase subunit beta [Candidatus Acidoferrales bacterium]|jgi:2-oxoglutarate ferredoxin oxidoreductase subunit beta|nr:2-oxoacid:ferredoxin oxidoreductase subunit beta [Candidatus Acidoferrales bacterium]